MGRLGVRGQRRGACCAGSGGHGTHGRTRGHTRSLGASASPASARGPHASGEDLLPGAKNPHVSPLVSYCTRMLAHTDTRAHMHEQTRYTHVCTQTHAAHFPHLRRAGNPPSTSHRGTC